VYQDAKMCPSSHVSNVLCADGTLSLETVIMRPFRQEASA